MELKTTSPGAYDLVLERGDAEDLYVWICRQHSFEDPDWIDDVCRFGRLGLDQFADEDVAHDLQDWMRYIQEYVVSNDYAMGIDEGQEFYELVEEGASITVRVIPNTPRMRKTAQGE